MITDINNREYSVDELIEFGIINKDSFGYFVPDCFAIVANDQYIINRFKLRNGCWKVQSGKLNYAEFDLDSLNLKIYTNYKIYQDIL
jgi:hypothetical protein